MRKENDQTYIKTGLPDYFLENKGQNCYIEAKYVKSRVA